MMGTSWGNTAVSNATAVGVNPSALAATCVLESGCSTPSGGSGAQGVFQMYPAAFQEGLQTALAADPSLASQIVQGSAGMNDPTTEAIAASGYLMQAAQTLQTQAYPIRRFFKRAGIITSDRQMASACAPPPDDAHVHRDAQCVASDVGREWGQSGETVGQWQASVSAKIGTAANQPCLHRRMRMKLATFSVSWPGAVRGVPGACCNHAATDFGV